MNEFSNDHPSAAQLRLARVVRYTLPVLMLATAASAYCWSGAAALRGGPPAHAVSENGDDSPVSRRVPLAVPVRETRGSALAEPVAHEPSIIRCQSLEIPPSQIYPLHSKTKDHPYRPDAGFENPLGPGFQRYFQGEYLARPRPAHVPEYRLRPDDECDFIYRLTREETTRPYEINVGDELRMESFTDRNLDRSLIVQPDGTVTLGLLGQIHATHHTISQLRDELEERYKKFYKVPAITITPLKVNTKLEDIRATVDSRAGFGGQTRHGRVTPEGTVGLPAIGSVPAQGLTLEELKIEINERYSKEVEGLEVTPVLTARAPRFMYVQGEVKTPGRYTMEGPTTVIQAITTAGGWNVGANIEQVVVLRRDENWQLVATMLNLRQAFLGRRSDPPAEIWCADYDVVIVPKTKILLFDNFAQLVFTNGIYRVIPFSTSVNFTAFSGAAAAVATTTGH